MERVLFALGDTPITLETALIAAAGLFGLLLLAVLAAGLARRRGSARSKPSATAARAAETERHLADVHAACNRR